MNNLDFINHIDYKNMLHRPFLYIGASVLEDETYEAFKVCYQSLRVMDDIIDDRRAGQENLPESVKKEISFQLNQMLHAIEHRQPLDSRQSALLEIMDRFQLPVWPWKKFAGSMMYDLENNGYKTLCAYMRYSEGAAIAPGAIYMQLCLSSNPQNDAKQVNLRAAARPLAVFSYLVHIFRDFQEDQNNRINNFAEDVIEKCGATPGMLRKATADGVVLPEVRNLMRTYHGFAEYYRQKTRTKLDELAPLLQPRCRLSLELIFSLYHLIYERIDPEHGSFTSTELQPSTPEIHERINTTIESFMLTKID